MKPRASRTRKPASAAGLTLIELMIGITILALLLLLGLPGYATWIQSSKIRTASESVQSGLQLARAEAVRRNTQVSFALTGNDWSVDVVNPVQNIQRRSGTDGTAGAVIAATQNVVAFNALGRVTPAATVTLSVTNPGGGTCQAAGGAMRCLNVTVLAGGQIRMCDPALPATNPQSC